MFQTGSEQWRKAKTAKENQGETRSQDTAGSERTVNAVVCDCHVSSGTPTVSRNVVVWSRSGSGAAAWRRKQVCYLFRYVCSSAERLLSRMRALLDGVFEAEEGFQEAENDDEFEYKGGE